MNGVVAAKAVQLGEPPACGVTCTLTSTQSRPCHSSSISILGRELTDEVHRGSDLRRVTPRGRGRG